MRGMSLVALSGHVAMSDLSPLSDAKQTSPSGHWTTRNCLFLCSSSSLYDDRVEERGFDARRHEFINLIDGATTVPLFSVHAAAVQPHGIRWLT